MSARGRGRDQARLARDLLCGAPMVFVFLVSALFLLVLWLAAGRVYLAAVSGLLRDGSLPSAEDLVASGWFLSSGLLVALHVLRSPAARRLAARWKLGRVEAVVRATGAGPGRLQLRLRPRAHVLIDGVQARLVAWDRRELEGLDGERWIDWSEAGRHEFALEAPREAFRGQEVDLDLPLLPPAWFPPPGPRREWEVEVAVRLAGWPDWTGSVPWPPGPAAQAAEGDQEPRLRTPSGDLR